MCFVTGSATISFGCNWCIFWFNSDKIVSLESIKANISEEKCENIFLFSAADQLAPYPVRISPDLVNRLENCLTDLNIQPVSIPRDIKPERENEESAVSLLVRLECSHFEEDSFYHCELLSV